MHDAPPVLIAGGGIAGLALALALARLGRTSMVLERQDAPATAGAGIQLGPNAVHALRWLGVAALLEPHAAAPEAIEVRAGASGRRLGRLPLGGWIAARHGAPYWVAHRGDLHGALAAAAAREPRIAVHHACEVVAVDEGAGQVTVRAATGRTFSAPVLIGADGLWSAVRQAIVPGTVPQPAGATAMRTVIPAGSAAGLGTASVGVWLSPAAHVVHYPVRSGDEVAVVVIARAERPQHAAADLRMTWDGQASLPRLHATLAHFHAGLREALAPRSGADWPWREWTLHALPPLQRWRSRRIALLGDAAHPMLPYLAQGGALALEDAVVLAHCRHAGAADPPSALARFVAGRTARAGRVQAASRRQGRIYHLPPPLSLGRDAALAAVPGARLMARYDWLYAWRPPQGTTQHEG